MSRRIVKGGIEYWFPDKYDAKRHETLDPELTPRENLWAIIYKVTCIWLTKAHVYATVQEDMDDLEAEVRMATYYRLQYLVRTRQYQRKYSFWVNCTRACWSICNAHIQRWFDRIHKTSKHMCGDLAIEGADVPLFDMLSFCPTLVTSSECESAQKMRWQDAQRPYERWKKLNEHVEDQYMEYTESCLELGITPVDKVSFVLGNYSEEERKLMDDKPTNSITYSNYYRNWRAKKKLTDPEWAERKRLYDKEYQKKYNEKRKAERRRKKAARKERSSS
jgi:hypothetical protein